MFCFYYQIDKRVIISYLYNNTFDFLYKHDYWIMQNFRLLLIFKFGITRWDIDNILLSRSVIKYPFFEWIFLTHFRYVNLL